MLPPVGQYRVRIWCGGALAIVLGWTIPAWAEGVAVEAATVEQIESAQREFQEGDRLYDVQRYEDALARYRASLAIVASPNTQLMVARTLQELNRLPEAHAEYEATIALAAPLAKINETYSQTWQAAQDELQGLKSRVALLTIELGDVPPDAPLMVGDGAVAASSLREPLVLMPGRTIIVATTPDGRTARAQVQLAAGRAASVTLKLGEVVTVGAPFGEESSTTAPQVRPRAPSGRPPARDALPEDTKEKRPSFWKPLAYAAGGIGVAGFVGFGVFGSMNNAHYQDLEAECPKGQCPPRMQDTLDSGRRTQLLANGCLAVGAVGLSGFAAFLYVGHRQDRKQKASLYVAPGEAGVRGRF